MTPVGPPDVTIDEWPTMLELTPERVQQTKKELAISFGNALGALPVYARSIKRPLRPKLCCCQPKFLTNIGFSQKSDGAPTVPVRTNLGLGRGGVLISPSVPYGLPPCMTLIACSEARGYGFSSKCVSFAPASAICHRHRLETASWPH